ncbi:Telomerase reverse transcriptase [Pleurostoma richardsiae]|uniref:Telomerase reverse transcriptase n=1 Tax=Pleurostoma richardsiae TaxID=41990 RepID=A0AA38VI93_9PEZI|nr:Telomerase reverse transcriptase [Pleurostoma richardsiae]
MLTLLGKSGESIMVDLLLDCSVFTSTEAGRSNYVQLSGMPIWDSEPSYTKATVQQAFQPMAIKPMERSPSEIVFVRSRMLYARAALNARGLVHFGLRHIHVLNRLPYHSEHGSSEQPKEQETADQQSKNDDNTARVMMYIFPRQFGLHNAFTSSVDASQTSQKLQDYTLREEEISEKLNEAGRDRKIHLPKRLRGVPQRLVQRLQILHQRCSYSQLLQHHCPIQRQANRSAPQGSEPTSVTGNPEGGKPRSKQSRHRRKTMQPSNPITTGKFTSLTELATPISQVSVFCQAVLSKVVPDEFWGIGDHRVQNKKIFMKNVDRFVRLRRFENMSLHDTAQGLKEITDLEWLVPPGLKGQKASQTDIRKREEIFHEFLYYLFDSLLIPLIRSNFYVTESNVHRYRLFFFRHDIWRYIAEPAMASLKAKMFEEVKLAEAMRILESRRLGSSQVRLLPKQSSVRPIMNLRRRTMARGNKRILGPSINTVLAPVHTMLKLEKTLNPARLGSTMFSVGDIYNRLKKFKQRLGSGAENKYYLAKIDVQAAFDTIPQSAIIQLMGGVPSQSRYTVTKHVEVRPNDNGVVAGLKTTKRWHSSAKGANDTSSFLEMIEKQFAPSRKHTVFVDGVVQRSYDARALIALMSSHVQENIVKIGKKYYRQKDGIPQGSILSSILCNYFYADLERSHLQFLQSNDCLLLRLIDDFLLITTDRVKASKFVKTMHRGLPEYGVTVNTSKSLVNFDLTVDHERVPRVPDGAGFPYCGTRLDCRTLAITKDRATVPRDPGVANALTVEFSRLPGQNFKRKVLGAFKIQSHLMYFDTAHNSARTTLRSLSAAFLETAAKAWAYDRCMPRGRRPGPRLMAATVQELVEAAFRLLTSRARSARYPGYKCSVNRTQVAWLAMHAFRHVLGRKQSRYGEVIAWLDCEIRKLDAKKEKGPTV